MKFNIIIVGCINDITDPWISHTNNISNILAFDPMGNIASTGKANVIYYDGVVSNQDGEQQFYICKRHTISSLYKPNKKFLKHYYGKIPSRFNVEKKVFIKSTRLDTILSDMSVKFNFLISDTQGADLEVIQSMGNRLQEMVGIHCEFYRNPVYEGSLLFEDGKKFLEQEGFDLQQVIELRSKHADSFLFVRKTAVKEEKEFLHDIYEGL